MIHRRVLVIGGLVIFFLLASCSSDTERLSSTLVAIPSSPAEQNEMANGTVQPLSEKSPTVQPRRIILPETKGIIEIKDEKISKNEVWKSGFVYVIQELLVPEASSLTIEPGVVIKFKNRGSIAVYGSLQALGTPEQPIIFTSIKDDTAGGDTNNDGGNSKPLPSDWFYIKFFSSGMPSVLKYVHLRYADPEVKKIWDNVSVNTQNVLIYP